MSFFFSNFLNWKSEIICDVTELPKSLLKLKPKWRMLNLKLFSTVSLLMNLGCFLFAKLTLVMIFSITLKALFQLVTSTLNSLDPNYMLLPSSLNISFKLQNRSVPKYKLYVKFIKAFIALFPTLSLDFIYCIYCLSLIATTGEMLRLENEFEDMDAMDD